MLIDKCMENNLKERILEVLDRIRPSLQAGGRDAELVGVEEGV